MKAKELFVMLAMAAPAGACRSASATDGEEGAAGPLAAAMSSPAPGVRGGRPGRPGRPARPIDVAVPAPIPGAADIRPIDMCGAIVDRVVACQGEQGFLADILPHNRYRMRRWVSNEAARKADACRRYLDPAVRQRGASLFNPAVLESVYMSAAGGCAELRSELRHQGGYPFEEVAD